MFRTQLVICLVLTGLLSPAMAEPTAEQAAYWWQDEIRAASFELSRARTGQVAQWPRMSVPAGSAVMPLPPAVGAITIDGKLDEPAWAEATRFPVGPIFDEWSQGPMVLTVRACRDEKNVYLAVEAPRDLAGLGALTPDAHLLMVGGKPYRVEQGNTLELALPADGELRLAFPVELVRRTNGNLPAGFASLGLDHVADGKSNDFRKPWLWLEPITVRLIPSAVAAKLDWSRTRGGFGGCNPQLESTIAATGVATKATRLLVGREPVPLPVSPFTWQADAQGETFSLDGFTYFDWFMTEINSFNTIAVRSPDAVALRADRDAFNARLTDPDATDRPAGRRLYCRLRELRARAHLSLIDAPLLFVKQHPYFAGHIYDDYYTWHPGGGLYVRERPNDARDTTVRTLIDATTDATLGEGVYRDAEVSWDGSRVLFANLPAADAMTSIFEIGADGSGLRRLTQSDKYHDITPAYLPDGRIVFTSTRPKALVPCFNSGVDTLHTMNADGSDIRSISSNLVTEFDPAVLPDGRVVYGRWEYVDKTALYMQSLWTMLPDGRMEEALFANNLAKPTAVLDAAAVPGTRLVAASLTPHNGQAAGAIGYIDTAMGKNDLEAVFNFTPEYPVEMDQGLRSGACDPCPISRDDVLFSNNSLGAHGIIELADRQGNRELVQCDPSISCYNPRLLKPRKRPPTIQPRTDETQTTGRFLLTDVYQGLEGVPRGSIKRLRVLEETARTSGLPPGGRWWNQAFLVSWQGAYIVKNVLGTVPVHEDGSAHFEVPSGRAIYFEALDAEGREIQRMRTFVQASPGVTRSCVGCHENKKTAAVSSGSAGPPTAMLLPVAKIEPESWGSGYVDYPTMVQPILDSHCVSCHGGERGMKAGLDFSGGWTWAFNISYETLLKHRMTGFLNCNNGSMHTSEILPPLTIGSGVAPLAETLIKKHPEVARHERDLIFAWMDTNSNYFGTWDYTPYATCDAILATRAGLSAVMNEAGCTECHTAGHIGADWVNLQTPEWSRILRAPMPKSEGGLGLAFCRKRPARKGYPLVNQSVQPPDVRRESIQPPWDPSGEEHVSIASVDDPRYGAMLDIIRHAQAEALAKPRIDMPGAEVVPGECRMQVPLPTPLDSPMLLGRVREDQAVELSWQRTADTIGLQYELHRGPEPQFTPAESTRIGRTTAGRFLDWDAPIGVQHYALLVTSGTESSRPMWHSMDIPRLPPPTSPANVKTHALPGEITLSWEGPPAAGLRYVVDRRQAGETQTTRLTPEAVVEVSLMDRDVTAGVRYEYTVRSLDRRGQESPASAPVEGTPLAEIKEPVFVVDLADGPKARLLDGSLVTGKLHGGAKLIDGALETGAGGFMTFPHQAEFDVPKAFSVECWVRVDRETQMPVVVAAGGFNTTGWFIQRYGSGWRWHVAPASCDGGRPVVGEWTHLVGSFDGRQAHLYQDGKLVRSIECYPTAAPSSGPLVVGQYVAQAPQYQVQGGVTGLLIYRRALKPEEVAAKFAAGSGR